VNKTQQNSKYDRSKFLRINSYLLSIVFCFGLPLAGYSNGFLTTDLLVHTCLDEQKQTSQRIDILLENDWERVSDPADGNLVLLSAMFFGNLDGDASLSKAHEMFLWASDLEVSSRPHNSETLVNRNSNLKVSLKDIKNYATCIILGSQSVFDSVIAIANPDRILKQSNRSWINTQFGKTKILMSSVDTHFLSQTTDLLTQNTTASFSTRTVNSKETP
jgi:hypothetical protein